MKPDKMINFNVTGKGQTGEDKEIKEVDDDEV